MVELIWKKKLYVVDNNAGVHCLLKWIRDQGQSNSRKNMKFTVVCPMGTDSTADLEHMAVSLRSEEHNLNL